jgi:NADP-dependent 3-hydroxy acid dehydrogenase YdfG
MQRVKIEVWMPEKSLKSRLALITGASAGIGRATALSLAAEGAEVVILARREKELEKLGGEIHASGGRVHVISANAAIAEEIDAALSKIAKIGPIDILIVNAGRGLAGGLLSSDEAQWQQMYQLNVLGAAHLMRRVGAEMVARKSGDIVVLGSVSGHNISAFSGFYGSTKFAIAGMAEAFRREVCAQGVRVTVIKPGIVESEFQAAAGYTAENFYKGVARFGKLLVPADVAEAILFVVTRPAHVHVNEVVIRPLGQDYP